MKPFHLAVAVIIACSIAPVSFADTIAVTTTPGTIFQDTGDFTLGWSFLVNAPITVSSLGAYDQDSDGLNAAHNVGLWDALGNLLASATVPSGTSGTLDSSYRFVSISPVLLNASSTYYVGAGYSSDDDGWLEDPATIVTAAELTYLSRQYEASFGSLVFPDLNNGSGKTGYFGGNFEFASAVPEPASIALIAGGLGLLALVRARKQSAAR